MTTLVAIVILCSCLLVSGARVPVYVGVLLELSDHWWSDYTKLFPILLNHALEDIYNTTDILRDYEIKLVVKDTKGKSGMSGKLLNELLSEGPPKPVVIGPGLSEEILVTGQIVPFYNVVQLSYAATTASTADKVLYPTTFSINPLPHQLNRVRIKMIQYFGWKRIGTIAFLTEFTKSQMDSLVDSNDPSSSFNVVTSALISDRDLKNNVKDAIQRLKQFDVRIIHGSFTRGYAPYVFCEAYRQGLYGRHYVWILSGPNLYSSWLDIANTTEVGCSIEELKLGSNGYFTLDYDKAGDSASMTIAGKTVAETEAEILELAKQSPYKLSTSSAHLYDTAYSLALGLNHSLKYLAAKRLSLQDFNYSKQYLDAIMAGLHETTFSGVSGPVSFDKNGFRLGVSSIYQHFNGNQTRVATYDYERDEFLSFINPWPGGPPPDRFSYAENQAPVSDLAFSLITILAGCGILLVGIFFIFNLKFRNQRSIKMSSPLMNSIILLGCFLLYFEVLLSAAFYRNFLKSDICMIRTWLLAFGFTTLFGALFAKTYRVYIIFRDVRHNTKIIRDYQLISMVAVMLLVDCVILVPWSIKYPLKITNISKAVKTEFVVYTTYYPQCQSDSEEYWFASLYIYKGLLLVFGVFLSWETRNVRVAELNDSKLIAACVYNVVIMCLFGVIVSHALPLDHITLGFSMETGIVLFCTSVCICILFIPKIQDRNKVHGKFILSPSVINRIETTDSNRVQEISDSQSNVISLTSENIKIIADLKAENNTLRMQVAKVRNFIIESAFGVVYKANWLGTPVAVNEIMVKRMKLIKHLIERELVLHSTVRHPHIIMLMAYATRMDKLLLVSELIVGETLDNLLFGDDHGTLSSAARLDICIKVTRAVTYLHHQNPLIIHRDIKPENVMVSRDLTFVKLCDMGLSKLKTMNTIVTTIAGGSAQPSTPAYQAPEMLLFQRSANAKIDVWALCCTVVEVLCEIPIWDFPLHQEEDPVTYITEQMRKEVVPDGVKVLKSQVCSTIYAVLCYGLSYRQEERPEALQIVEAFQQMQSI